MPSRVGPAAALWIARASHVVTVLALVLLGAAAGLGWLYFAGVGIVALLLVIENLLVAPNDFSKVNIAFFTVNGVVSLLLGVVAVVDVLLGLSPLVPLG